MTALAYERVLPFPLGHGVLNWATHSGTPLTIRHITPDDAPLFVELFGRLSAETLWLRFATVLTSLPMTRVWEHALKLTKLDPLDSDALIALHEEAGVQRIVAVARFAGTSPTSAEFALLVRDDFQGQGIGSYLFDLLVQIALVRGLESLSATILAENRAMLSLVRRLGFPFEMHTSYGETEVLIDLRPITKDRHDVSR